MHWPTWNLPEGWNSSPYPSEEEVRRIQREVAQGITARRDYDEYGAPLNSTARWDWALQERAHLGRKGLWPPPWDYYGFDPRTPEHIAECGNEDPHHLSLRELSYMTKHPSGLSCLQRVKLSRRGLAPSEDGSTLIPCSKNLYKKGWEGYLDFSDGIPTQPHVVVQKRDPTPEPGVHDGEPMSDDPYEDAAYKPPPPESAQDLAMERASNFFEEAKAAYDRGVWQTDASHHARSKDVNTEFLKDGTTVVQPKEGKKTLRLAYLLLG